MDLRAECARRSRRLRGLALEESSVGMGATEVTCRELSEVAVSDIVRAEAAERLEAAARLTEVHANRAALLRAEADVLTALLDQRIAELTS